MARVGCWVYGTPGCGACSRGDVQCLSEAQSGGGGIGAAYTVGTEKRLWLHLPSCTPGNYGIGEQFATTGNTGRSTGAHLDYRVKDLASGEWVRPYADVL